MPTTHTVTGKFSKGSQPSAGKVIFTPTNASRHAGDGVILAVDEIEVDLNEGGAFAVELYATDDAGWSPAFQWQVTERIINGQTKTYTFGLTADTDLASVAEA